MPPDETTFTIEYLQGLMSKGYTLRMQKVNGDFFVFASHYGDKPQIAAKAKTLIDCARIMEKDEAQGKEPE